MIAVAEARPPHRIRSSANFQGGVPVGGKTIKRNKRVQDAREQNADPCICDAEKVARSWLEGSWKDARRSMEGQSGDPPADLQALDDEVASSRMTSPTTTDGLSMLSCPKW